MIDLERCLKKMIIKNHQKPTFKQKSLSGNNGKTQMYIDFIKNDDGTFKEKLPKIRANLENLDK